MEENLLERHLLSQLLERALHRDPALVDDDNLTTDLRHFGKNVG